uniref:Uncharacterized protein n=1 Tax=Onchocerca volvulus TaxID=6282 RepID=A0A8R1TNF0_ONCVO
MEEEEMQSLIMALIDETRFSFLLKLMRTILCVLRFLAKVSKEKIRNLEDFSRENFNSKEYEKATQSLAKMAQSNITQKEIKH